MSEYLLASTADLAANPQWRVFDCRYDLSAPEKGVALFESGHIPGALHVHMDRDLSAPKSGTNGRHPLPDPGSFAGWLGARGVRQSDQIVAYDDSGGAYAARLWWMLRWIGHETVAVLDGGFSAWVAEGRPVTNKIESFTPVHYLAEHDAPRTNEVMRVDVATVEANLCNPRFQVLDARAAHRFAGHDETIDPIAGHIPGALNRPFMSNLTAEGFFKPPQTLREEFAALLGSRAPFEVVHQCGSGITAAHNLLAMEVAGLRGSRLYPGSWSEWCSDPRRPIASGAD
jgi:thiosulfate/3-mercaptopyruvate sulfurtransferase